MNPKSESLHCNQTHTRFRRNHTKKLNRIPELKPHLLSLSTLVPTMQSSFRFQEEKGTVLIGVVLQLVFDFQYVLPLVEHMRSFMVVMWCVTTEIYYASCVEKETSASKRISPL